MSTLLIYAHPYEKSFNATLCNHLADNKKDVEIIDLYADKFYPVYSKEELKLFKYGQTENPLIKDYQKKIKNCTEMIVIFPIWWNDLPGILKGFIDLVMKKEFAYSDSARGVTGKLSFIHSVTAITTSNSPTWYLKWFAGNSIQSVFLNATCKQLGIKKRTWMNLGSIKNTTVKERQNFLKKCIEI